MLVRNPQYSNADGTTIDVELNHPEYGWMPFTASPDDPEELGRDIYAAAIAGEYGPVAPYVAPPPEPEPTIPQAVTRRQGRLALLSVGKLADVEAAIGAITDPAERMAAQIEYEADTWERSNAFLQSMWAQLGGTEEQLDDLFMLASTL